MAGDWIRIDATTPDKPEIDALAELLGCSVNEVLGGLVRFWIWSDQQTIDGNALSITKSALDRHSGITGFADAMLSERVGWLIERPDGSFCLPNFGRHNGQTSKRRALTARRVAAHKKRSGNAEVTLSALPREEKRRVIQEQPSVVCSEPPSARSEPPAPGSATEWCFPVRGKGPSHWRLPAAKLDEYRQAFPGIDLEAELRKARQWTRDNPSKRKTASGMLAFLTRWLSRAANQPQTHGGSRGTDDDRRSGRFRLPADQRPKPRYFDPDADGTPPADPAPSGSQHRAG